MKRIGCLLLVLLSLTANAEQVITPSWSEFCPVKYLNAQPVEVSKPPGAGLLVLSAATFMATSPLIFYKSSKYKKTYIENYWAKRRLAFENELALCDKTESDKAMCYLQVRQLETQKNDSMLTRQAIQDSAYQIHQSVNRIRNESW